MPLQPKKSHCTKVGGEKAEVKPACSNINVTSDIMFNDRSLQAKGAVEHENQGSKDNTCSSCGFLNANLPY